MGRFSFWIDSWLVFGVFLDTFFPDLRRIQRNGVQCICYQYTRIGVNSRRRAIIALGDLDPWFRERTPGVAAVRVGIYFFHKSTKNWERGM